MACKKCELDDLILEKGSANILLRLSEGYWLAYLLNDGKKEPEVLQRWEAPVLHNKVIGECRTVAKAEVVPPYQTNGKHGGCGAPGCEDPHDTGDINDGNAD